MKYKRDKQTFKALYYFADATYRGFIIPAEGMKYMIDRKLMSCTAACGAYLSFLNCSWLPD